MKKFKLQTRPKIRSRYRTDLWTRLRVWHKHPVIFAVSVFAALALVGGVLVIIGLRNNSEVLTVNPQVNRIVHVRVDGEDQIVPTDEKTVGDLLEKLDITLDSGDRVEPAADAEITVDNFLINVYRAAPVVVIDGNTEIRTKNAAGTYRSMVEQAGVTIYPADIITSEPTDTLLGGTLGYRIVIDRATPISFSLYSADPVAVRTQAETVGEWIEQSSITLDEKDTVKPALDTPITAGLSISVIRDGIHTVTVEETIAAPVRSIIDTSLAFGTEAVRQAGSDGTRVKTYKVTVEDGNEVSRELVQSVVTVQAVERVVAKGNAVNIPSDKQAVMAAAGIAQSDYAYVDYIFSRESHWNTAAVSANGRYYGLGQTSLARLSAACPNWQTDAVCQTRVFNSYMGRYGSWEAAYNFWINNHWW